MGVSGKAELSLLLTYLQQRVSKISYIDLNYQSYLGLFATYIAIMFLNRLVEFNGGCRLEPFLRCIYTPVDQVTL